MNMRRFYIFLAFAAVALFATTTFAYEVPKDAVIKVYTKDGKQIGEMSRSEYKVVKLGTSKVKVVEKLVEKPAKTRYSVVLGGGVGLDGLDVNNDGKTYEVSRDKKPVGSLGMCVTKKGSGFCVKGQTNKTGLLEVLIPIGGE